MTTTVTADDITALLVGAVPGVDWKHNDDLCDCVYQRVCQWTNPYIGQTHEIRLCCAWAKMQELFPEAVRDIPAWFDFNANEWVAEPQEWNGEDAMPRAIWYRQLAAKEGRPLSEIREDYADQDPPQGVPTASPRPLAQTAFHVTRATLDAVEIAAMERALQVRDEGLAYYKRVWAGICETNHLDPAAVYNVSLQTGTVTLQ